jgi:hypothetical protein
LHFLVQNGSIITHKTLGPISRLNLTGIDVVAGSLLEATSESFYIINSGIVNSSAFIWRVLRRNELNLTKVLQIAKNKNLAIANLSTLIPTFENLDLN